MVLVPIWIVQLKHIKKITQLLSSCLTPLVDYLAVDEVKANVQAKLQAYGRRDWEQAHTVLFEYFARQSTRSGGGTVTHASVVKVLGPSPEPALRDKELAYLDRLLARYEYWLKHYTPLAGIASSGIVLLLVLLLGPILTYLPLAVISGTLMLVGIGMIKTDEIIRLASWRGELAVFSLTLFSIITATLLVGRFSGLS